MKYLIFRSIILSDCFAKERKYKKIFLYDRTVIKMNLLQQLVKNKAFVAPFIAWLTAQLIKTVTHYFVHKKFDIKVLFSDGGMPSGHSATVMALAITIAIVYGVGGPMFAIAAVLAVIVMNDAVGVRRETGRHAERINEIFSMMSSDKLSDEEKLKVLVGHTPFQVLMGAVLGTAIGIIVGYFL